MKAIHIIAAAAIIAAATNAHALTLGEKAAEIAILVVTKQVTKPCDPQKQQCAPKPEEPKEEPKQPVRLWD